MTEKDRRMSAYAMLRAMIHQIATALACVIIATAAIAQDTAKRYPPYPDVWGIDLPTAQERAYGTCGNPRTNLYHLPDGELRFLVFYWEGTKTKECQGGRAVFSFVDFFRQSIEEVPEETYEAFKRENHNRWVAASAIRADLKLESGDIIRHRELGVPDREACPRNLTWRLERLDPSGKVVNTHYLFELLEIPDEITLPPECTGLDAPRQFKVRVVNRFQGIAKLADGTFVAWGGKSPAIFRFTADFETMFRSRHELHWVDNRFIEAWFIHRLIVGPWGYVGDHNYLYNTMNKPRASR
jgi:hypothetical protein